MPQVRTTLSFLNLRVLAWKTPLPDREAWQATVYRVAESDTTEVTLRT